MKPQLKPQRIKFYPIAAFAGVERDPNAFPDESYLYIKRGHDLPSQAFTLRDGQLGNYAGGIIRDVEFAAIVEFRKPSNQ